MFFSDETSVQERKLKRTEIRVLKKPVYAASKQKSYSLNLMAIVSLNKVISLQTFSHRLTIFKFKNYISETIKYYGSANMNLNLVLNNCNSYLNPFIIDTAEKNKNQLIFLPPKTPLYNLCEFFFPWTQDFSEEGKVLQTSYHWWNFRLC